MKICRGIEMKKATSYLGLLLLLLLGGCSDEDKLKEQTQIQTKEQIDAENNNRIAWANKLENDLEKRRNFISAIEGEYEGEFGLNKEEYFTTKILIVPTLPLYNDNRDRTLNELEYELQNLNIQIKTIETSNDGLLTIGCIFDAIKPDLQKGYFVALSSDCPITFRFYVSSSEVYADSQNDSQNVATDLRNGSISIVDYIYVKRGSVHQAKERKYNLRRIK